jgi:DNA polymerase-3 subunit alpha
MADELSELSKQNKYTNFVDLLVDINTKTSTNSRQLTILTGLNFFSEFGKNKYLLNIIDIYNTFYNKKQINKKDLDKLGITEAIAEKYSNKITNTLYKELDTIGLVNELINKVENKPMSVVEQVKFELEYLEYTTYINPDVSEKFDIVIDFKVYKSKTKPYFLLRNIKTGEEMKTKIKDGQLFVENPFNQFNILKVEEFKTQFKMMNNGGKWERSKTETEEILVQYNVVG